MSHTMLTVHHHMHADQVSTDPRGMGPRGFVNIFIVAFTEIFIKIQYTHIFEQPLARKSLTIRPIRESLGLASKSKGNLDCRCQYDAVPASVGAMQAREVVARIVHRTSQLKIQKASLAQRGHISNTAM
eukprot:3270257-Karenia_brevis.AAC.1